MTFLDYLTSNLTHQNILDLANNGADGGFPGLTYDADCALVWSEHEDEILEALIMDAEDMGYADTGEFISSFNRSDMMSSTDGLKTLLVWYMAEREARRYADAVEAA